MSQLNWHLGHSTPQQPLTGPFRALYCIAGAEKFNGGWKFARKTYTPDGKQKRSTSIGFIRSAELVPPPLASIPGSSVDRSELE